jgi:hypothetical protein
MKKTEKSQTVKTVKKPFSIFLLLLPMFIQERHHHPFTPLASSQVGQNLDSCDRSLIIFFVFVFGRKQIQQSLSVLHEIWFIARTKSD